MPFDAVGPIWFVLEVSLRALAAAAAVAVLVRVLRVRAAAVLHSAWTAVLFAMLFMPVLPSVVPALPVPVPAGPVGVLDLARRTEQPLPPVPQSARPARGDTRALPSIRTRDAVVPDDLRPTPVTSASVRWLYLVLLGGYAAGVLLAIAHLLYGWLLASAMIRRARRGSPLDVDAAGPVYESPEVIVPITLGAIRPVIVLPVAWKTWDSDTLAAIIEHESAHVRRRDASINFTARLNRAMFWFHPLAWWLERTLAATAEHACDEAAARAIAAPDRYAEILLEMADVVRRNGGRLAWQGVGVDGAGLLERRIDRLLRGDGFAGASRGKRMAVAIGCLLAIATVVACRQQRSAPPLRADPALAQRLADGEQQRKSFEAARDMTEEQADALEQRVTANPEDLDARRQLVTYYRQSSTVAWDKKVPGLRRHALWLIEHHPEDEIEAPAVSPQFDPEGFASAKRLWEPHLAPPDAPPFLLYRAASFFAPHDKPYAEQLILRGMALDPDSAALRARMPPDAGGYEWPIQLSSLYAAALLGSESVWGTYNDLRTHLDQVHSPFAMQVRQTLQATSDARLLTHVGSSILTSRASDKDPAINQALEEVRALGIGYLERALELDPNLEAAKATLVRLKLPEHANEADRLAARAFEGYIAAEDIPEYVKKDAAVGTQQRDEARGRAEQVLKMAAAHAQDPAYSAAVMTAHHVLATVALRDGDRERAVRHMQESLNVPASEQIRYAPPFSWLRPVNRLLKEGERERVVEFLEAFARLTISGRDRLLRDAQAIREGRMPSAYQVMVFREGP